MKSRGSIATFDHEEIKRLLESGFTHYDIAKKLGCSRERIRQLDMKYFGKTGQERRDARLMGIRLQKKSIPTHLFVTEAQRRGLFVQSAMSSFSGNAYKGCVFVNGWLCALRIMTEHWINGRRYYNILRYRSDADFYILQNPKGFLILPFDKQPERNTITSLEPRSKPGGYSHRHDYVNYLNAWEQLRKPKHENLKAS